MTVYVDNFRAPARVGRISGRWSHLTADDRDELHAFAERLGLQRSWFQDKGDGYWHYDVTDAKRAEAIRLGAVPIDIRDMGAFISGRRRREAGKPPVRCGTGVSPYSLPPGDREPVLAFEQLLRNKRAEDHR